MKIALLGYGKMGKAIEEIATAQGHEIVLATSDCNASTNFNGAHVAIEFSVPNAAYNNCKMAIDAGIPVISGTTGWLKEYERLVAHCRINNGAFLYASNFSLGVNIFFAINKQLSRMLYNKGYTAQMKEIHHTQKLDAPSGTAITLANQIIENTDYDSWSLENKQKDSIFIDTQREGDVKGTHTVEYQSVDDSIEITHRAHTRDGFAKGALTAAAWIIGKKGVFKMNDVLNIR